MTPGIVRDMPAAEYHAVKAISASLLKRYVDNPSTCREPFISSDDMAVGSAIHAFSLGGEEALFNECVIMPESCEGTSKGAKQARADIATLHPGKTLVPHRYGTGAAETKPPIMDVLKGVDFSLQSHPKVGPVLRNSEKELSLFWVDPVTGASCKARLDVWHSSERTILDPKKCTNLNKFIYNIKDYHYLVQAGWYYEGAKQCGLDPIAFGFIPVTATHPYEVDFGYVSYAPRENNPDFDPDGTLKIKECAENARRLAGLLQESIVTNYWPNFSPPLNLYSWKDFNPDDLVKLY